MALSIKVLPAGSGDCILLSYGENQLKSNILIDGGTGILSYHRLKDEIQMIADSGEFVDLLVLTHTDEDHIEGILNIYKDSDIDKSIIKKIWFNSGRVVGRYLNEPNIPSEASIKIEFSEKSSVGQGIELDDLLESYQLNRGEILAGYQEPIGGAIISVLSPEINGIKKFFPKWKYEQRTDTYLGHKTDYHLSLKELYKKNKFKKDNSFANQSSIAFLFEYEGYKALLLGDADPSVVVNSLRKYHGIKEGNELHVNVVKLSHHGSKGNTNEKLLNHIRSKQFIISSDGNQGLPDKECLARIIKFSPKKVEFIFNSSLEKLIFLDEDYKDFDFSCIDLSESENEYTLEITL